MVVDGAMIAPNEMKHENCFGRFFFWHFDLRHRLLRHVIRIKVNEHEIEMQNFYLQKKEFTQFSNVHSERFYRS